MNVLKEYTRSAAQVRRCSRRGRSQHLLRRRDEKIAVRFYYHAHLHGKTYADIIENLQDEFDLSEKAITTSLRANQSILDELFKNTPRASELRKRYSYFRF